MNTGRAPSGSHRAIRPLDLAFLLGETHAEPLHVGALLVFDAPPPGAGWTPADLVATYRRSAVEPPFNRIPKFPLLGQPRWLEHGELDMHYHVRHLRVPAPGGEKQLCQLVQELHSSPLDRGQPLFRAFVIEGLAGGGLALYTKVHHALVDGISGLMRVVASLSPEADAAIGAPFFASMPSAARRKSSANAGSLAHTTDAILEQARAAGDLSVGAVRKLLAALAGAPEANTLFVAPVTPINTPVRNGRALALLSLPMDEVRAIAHKAQGTINDAMLAIVDSAVNRYLIERHAGVRRPLVAMVPVSLRTKGDTRATTKASAITSALGDPGSPPPARLRRIIERLEAAKAEIRAMSKAAATNNAIAMYVLAVGLGSLGIDRPAVNLIVSNVPGPDGTLYLGGARLRGLYPVSAVSAHVGLNVTLVSQGGQMHVGLVSDRNQLPDLEHVAALCVEAFEELRRNQSARGVRASPARGAKTVGTKRRRKASKGA
jgi:WS/DGAT/MGAT family acyltransferase